MRKLSAGLAGLLIVTVLVAVGPTAASAACDYSAADQNGGWGWDPVNRTSCPPFEVEPDQPQPPRDDEPEWQSPPDVPDMPIPISRWCPTDPDGRDYDSDGDGWGWHDDGSCQVQFPRHHDPALEDRVVSLITHGGSGTALTQAEKREVARHIVAAYGHRPDLINYWADKATRMSMIELEYAGDGLYIAGWNRCHHYGWDNWEYKKFRGHMELSSTTEFIVVHEFAHAIDCSDRGGTLDGIGLSMTSAEQAAFTEERRRLFAEWNSVDRGELSRDLVAGLRFYAFTNNREFFAEASEVFLSRSNGGRIAMAQEAPKLYDTLRTYYDVEHWPTADEVEAPSRFPSIPPFDFDDRMYAAL